MAEDYVTKQVEIAGQIVCELIRKDILPGELKGGAGMTVSELGDVLGALYQHIWKAIANAPKSQ